MPSSAIMWNSAKVASDALGAVWVLAEERNRIVPAAELRPIPPTPSPPVPQKRPLLFELRRRRQGCWP